MNAFKPSLLLLFPIGALIGCQPPPPSLPTRPDIEGNEFVGDSSSLFSHTKHFSQHFQGKVNDCVSCHTYQGNRGFARPGHKACSSSGCHENEFDTAKINSSFCQDCHLGTKGGLHYFPFPKRGTVALIGFQHQKHLSHVRCLGCHAPSSEKPGTISLPKHKECDGCHGDSAGNRVVKPLLNKDASTGDCITCHTDARKNPTTVIRRSKGWSSGQAGGTDGVYSKELRFSHQTHPLGTCKECHQEAENSIQVEELLLPSMLSCEQCHKDTTRVSKKQSMDNCETCHTKLKKKEKPEDPLHYGEVNHIIGVKTRQTVYCAYCHDKNPGVFSFQPVYKDREACAGCHKLYKLDPYGKEISNADSNP